MLCGSAHYSPALLFLTKLDIRANVAVITLRIPNSTFGGPAVTVQQELVLVRQFLAGNESLIYETIQDVISFRICVRTSSFVAVALAGSLYE